MHLERVLQWFLISNTQYRGVHLEFRKMPQELLVNQKVLLRASLTPKALHLILAIHNDLTIDLQVRKEL